MKVLSYRTNAPTPGLTLTVDKTLRTNTYSLTPITRHALRLLLDEFWAEKPGEVEPQPMGSREIFLPGLKADALPRARAALGRTYRFRKRTVSQNQAGVVTVVSPHSFLWRDIYSLTLMAGIKGIRYAGKTRRRRNVIEFTLTGKQTLDVVMREIDAYMK